MTNTVSIMLQFVETHRIKKKKQRRIPGEGNAPLFCVWNGVCGLLVQQFLQAVRTDVLPLEDGDILGAVTENAGGLILFQHDRRPVHINLQGILFGDVQCASEFDGEDDSPQFVDPTDNSSGFHV